MVLGFSKTDHQDTAAIVVTMNVMLLNYIENVKVEALGCCTASSFISVSISRTEKLMKNR